MALSELDVKRDVLDLQFITKGGSEDPDDSADVNFFMTMTGWDSNGIKVKVNFSDPSVVSAGEVEDKVLCTIQNRDLFVAKATGKVLGEDKAKVSQIFPKQLPFGIDESILKGQAETARNAMLGILLL